MPPLSYTLRPAADRRHRAERRARIALLAGVVAAIATVMIAVAVMAPMMGPAIAVEMRR